MRRSIRALSCVVSIPGLFVLTPLFASCSQPAEQVKPTPGDECVLQQTTFEAGDPDGHKDPFGAKAAGQARAGRLASVDGVAQPAHGRQKVEVGDYVLANDKIAVFIENKGMSDGYARFGGEILGIDAIGDDGKPKGLSRYVETLTGLSIEMINPTSVTVLADGSNGEEAIVRVAGKLEGIPFMQGPLANLFPRRFGLEAAYDFVLRPGEERVTMRVGVINNTLEDVNFGVDRIDSDELYGFFHYSQSQMVTREFGYGTPKGKVDYVGFDSGPLNFAFRFPGQQLTWGLDVSGFALFYGPGFLAPACAATMEDRAEIVAGGPDYDGLQEALRRVSKEPAHREVKGKVTSSDGAGVADAWVHVVDAAGEYQTRTRTGADGAFTVHVRPGEPMTIVPQKQGYAMHSGFGITADETNVTVPLDAHGSIHVTAKDKDSNEALPVRVQVIPAMPEDAAPASFGVESERNGRLHQLFVMNGDATVAVPPGMHRVIVSRGYEWELFDVEVGVNPGETTNVDAVLEHSVDSTGYMCADFHIHSALSADSNDLPDHKVRGAIADGLEIPISSEHEWVLDFNPIVQQMGMAKWAFGMASEELTTFTWGHFGVVPMTPDQKKANNGAVDWVGKDPKDVFGLVRALPGNPVLIVNHPSGSGFGAYFSAAQYDRNTGTGKAGFWSDDFDAIEVFNDSDFESNREGSIADWFSMLNNGLKFWAVGSSDSHSLRSSPIGYPRTCLNFGHDDPQKLTKELVRDKVANGPPLISGGLFMTVTGPNGEAPAQVVKTVGGKATFTVTVQAASHIDATKLEVLVNGESVATEELLPMGGSGSGKKFMNQVTVSLDPAKQGNWVVFHAKGEKDLAPLHPGRRPFAATNPFFLE
jgi:Carboxypeptidase regulatory-like domain